MSEDMAELLRVLLGLGGIVTASSWWALPGHTNTKKALQDRGCVVYRVLYATRASKYVSPNTRTTLYFRETGAESVAGVYFVTPAGRAALADYHAAPDAGLTLADASQPLPQVLAQIATTPAPDGS